MIRSRRVLYFVISGVALGTLIAATFAIALTSSAAGNALLTLPNSQAPASKVGKPVGHHNPNDQITFGLLLQNPHEADLVNFVKAQNDPKSASYHQWLTPDQFEARFGPSSAQIASAQSFLKGQGFSLVDSPSSAIIMATGSSSKVEAAFHTTLDDYQANGQQYFANSTPVSLPKSLIGSISGIAGLSSASLEQTHQKQTTKTYGGAPYQRGLTPSQIASLYDANPVYSKLNDSGQRATLAVYELSGYRASDIDVYKKQFGLGNVSVVNKPVLGGPIPVQQGGSKDYGATEVELDIELQLAVAPHAKKLLVYESPNTEVGALAQYAQIAKDNIADSISSSWGIDCEAVVNSQITQSENNIFLQMASQGQSIFVASGDSGSLGCTRYGITFTNPTDNLQVGDPQNQPYVTAVGGTSFNTFNPGSDPHPSYHTESVWNNGCTTANLCAGGAGGGGVSRIWAMPDYQQGVGLPFVPPGVIESPSATQLGGTQSGAYCGQQVLVNCRELPDISADADPATGYGIYCTDPGDPTCAPGSPYSHHGWIQVGGTSCSAPVWAGFAALDITHNKGRLGLFGYQVYETEYNTSTFANEFHDITIGDNGEVNTSSTTTIAGYNAGPAYDMATGNGTPDVYEFVTATAFGK